MLFFRLVFLIFLTGCVSYHRDYETELKMKLLEKRMQLLEMELDQIYSDDNCP